MELHGLTRFLSFTGVIVRRVVLLLDDGFFRQLESINLSYKSFVHCPETINYLGMNWNKKSHTMTLDKDTTEDKLVYMPLESDIK